MGEGAPEGAKGGKYGVKLVRGPFVQLPPHPEECDEDDFLAYAARLRAGWLPPRGRSVQRGRRPEPWTGGSRLSRRAGRRP